MKALFSIFLVILSYPSFTQIVCKGSFSDRKLTISISNLDTAEIKYDYEANIITHNNLHSIRDDRDKGLLTGQGFAMVYQMFSGRITNAKVTTFFKHRYKTLPSIATIDVLCEQ